MRLGALLYTLGYGGAMLALCMVIPLVVSILGGHWGHARNFTVGLTLTTFVSGAMVISGLPTRRTPARNIELLLIMLLFWFVLPLLASIPLTGAVQVRSFFAGYFEAVSGLTTSGGGVIAYPQLEDAPILVWRALLGWLGGLWTLVFAVGVLAPFAVGGLSLVGSPLLQHNEDDSLSVRLGRPLRIIFPYYISLTGLGIIGIAAGGDGFFAAFCLALSGISGTGTSIVSGSISDQFSLLSQFSLTVLCVLSALSLPALVAMTHIQSAQFIREAEFRVFISIVAVFAVVSALTQESQGYLGIIFQAISLATTAGFNFLPGDSLSDWPVLWVMLPVAVGGMGLSMAGGVKINRAILVGRELASELRRLAYPSSVSVTRMRGRTVDMADFSATWSYMAIFILSLSVAIIALGAFGLDMESVWAVTFGALTNSLAIVPHLGLESSLATMSSATQFFIIILMIAGRIELLVLLVIFSARFRRLLR
ncbi:MAG: Trk system potassium uptake protein TrkH [Rhodobiaceae bacterium UBA7378]|nr:MAG: Trk system potassium uptake protein TrkH [Rhodobiaceae bacterium UBA7378]|tara:strand:- start:4155 stop:5594 length:1440 start_codon:yes stop_codon:yes gene_type:complete